MDKCMICGADIEDGKKLCENCQSQMDTVEGEDLDISGLDEFDFSEIELPELSGDLYETDLEFQLEDPDNNLENPDIFVHDFDIDEFQLSEEEEQKIEEDIAGIEIPEFSEEEKSISTELTKEDKEEPELNGLEIDLSDLPEAEVSMSENDNTSKDADIDIMEDIPDISDILETAALEDSDSTQTGDFQSEDANISEADSLLDGFEEESADTEEKTDTKTEEELLLADIDNLLNEASKSEEEEDLLDLLSGEDGETTDSSDLNSTNDAGLLDDLLGDMDDDLKLMEDLPDEQNLEENTKKKPKMSIWKRLFGNIKDEKWKKQKEKEEKLEAEKLAKKEAEKKKAEDGENGEGENKPEIDPKEAKKAAKQAKKEEKARKKEEKKAQKQKMKELAELEDADEGRINRVGATIVFAFFGICAAAVIIGTNVFSYQSSISRATVYFDEDKYNHAYDALWGLDIKEKDAEFYSKVQMVMYLNKEWNSYENYTNIRMYPEALDSLLKGIQKYDSHIEDAKELEVTADYKKIRGEIIKKLKEDYGLTEKEAYKILNIENQEEYSQKVIQLADAS